MQHWGEHKNIIPSCYPALNLAQQPPTTFPARPRAAPFMSIGPAGRRVALPVRSELSSIITFTSDAFVEEPTGPHYLGSFFLLHLTGHLIFFPNVLLVWYFPLGAILGSISQGAFWNMCVLPGASTPTSELHITQNTQMSWTVRLSLQL